MSDFWPNCCCDEPQRYSLVFGGYTITAANMSQAAVYDHVTDSWSSSTVMPELIAEMAASGAAGQLGSICGTTGGSGITPTNHTYTGQSWAVGTNFPSSRQRQKIAAANVLGGRGSGGVVAENYQQTGLTWTSETAMTAAREFHSANWVASDLYAQGGSNASTVDTNYRYDQAGSSWSTQTAITASRRRHDSISDRNDVMSVTGGDDGTTVQSTHYLYSESGNSWSTASALGATRAYSASTSPDDDIGHLFGGGTAVGFGSQTNNRYTFSSNAWSSKTNLSIASRWFGGAGEFT